MHAHVRTDEVYHVSIENGGEKSELIGIGSIHRAPVLC